MWIIVETYYKNAEYELIIKRTEEELREYLIKSLTLYKKCISAEDIEDDRDIEDIMSDDFIKLSTNELITKAVYLGNWNVSNEYGWGIREIREE